MLLSAFLVAGSRTEPALLGSSVLEEFALEVLMFASFAPCRDRGGGGGGANFELNKGSTVLGAGLGRGSMEYCDDMVKDELLRDLFPSEDDLN